MTMQKKDYDVVTVALQAAFDNATNEAERKIVWNIANSMAVGFKRFNPRFADARFFKAIGFDVQPSHVQVKKVQK